jgi:hypothetical protein
MNWRTLLKDRANLGHQITGHIDINNLTPNHGEQTQNIAFQVVVGNFLLSASITPYVVLL